MIVIILKSMLRQIAFSVSMMVLLVYLIFKTFHSLWIASTLPAGTRRKFLWGCTKLFFKSIGEHWDNCKATGTNEDL